MASKQTVEQQRLEAARHGTTPWKLWGHLWLVAKLIQQQGEHHTMPAIETVAATA